MKSRKRKDNIIKDNFMSIAILMVFLILELLYLNIGIKSNFSNAIDNAPINIKTFIDNSFNKKVKEHSLDLVDNEILENIATYSDVIVDTDVVIPITEKKLKFATVMEDYFDNALFIGDSRMVGFSIYRKYPNATYFCYQSASAFNILDTEMDVEGYGNVKLTDLLTLHKFDKIYITLGINSTATGIPNHSSHYKSLLDVVTITQPQAIVYLMANMHVTDEINTNNVQVNNYNINLVNDFIKKFADNRQMFYLDPNEMYDDENGNLIKELTSDNAHVYIRHYDRYLYFLLTHALIEDTDSAK